MYLTASLRSPYYCLTILSVLNEEAKAEAGVLELNLRLLSRKPHYPTGDGMAGQVSSFVESQIGTGESGMQGHVDGEFIKSFGRKLVRHPTVTTIVGGFPVPGFRRVRAGD